MDPSQGPSGLAALLTSMVSCPVVVLHSGADLDRPYALMESTELMEGVTLGDVLAEELGLEIPYDAMVLIEPLGYFDNQTVSGSKLGELLGLALLDVAHPSLPSKAGKRDVDGPDLGDPIVALSDFAQNCANRLQ